MRSFYRGVGFLRNYQQCVIWRFLAAKAFLLDPWLSIEAGGFVTLSRPFCESMLIRVSDTCRPWRL
jgi:hypothetical protein